MIRSLVLLAAAGAAAAYLYSRGRPAAPRKAAPMPDDRGIEEAVRARLAGVVADPGAVHVTVREGIASLRGPVLPGERDRALNAVLSVPGVLEVSNFLEPVEPAQRLAT